MLNWFKKKEVELEAVQIKARRVSLTIWYFNENLKLGGCSRFCIYKDCDSEEDVKKAVDDFKNRNTTFLKTLQEIANIFVSFEGALIIQKSNFIKSEITVD